MATTDQSRVTVIVCTLAEEHRLFQIQCALHSIKAASKHPVDILVVVNGDRKSDRVIEVLRSHREVTLLFLDEASLAQACLLGRLAVQTPFYCFLDDDDEYLPLAIDQRLAVLEAQAADVVVTNGYLRVSGVDQPCIQRFPDKGGALFASLFQENWLASCGALFRAETVGPELFEDGHAFVEWTWLAFKLCMLGKNIVLLDSTTFRVYDTPGSASKSSNYFDAMMHLYRRMIDSQPPLRIRYRIWERVSGQLHVESDRFLQNGEMRKAWGRHIQSVLYAGGWKYLSYTRRLLRNPLRKK